MNDTWLDFLKQAPPLVVLVIVVYIFLQHLKARDDQFAEVVRAMNQENLTAREESQRVIDKNSVAIEKSIETRGELLHALRQLKEKL